MASKKTWDKKLNQNEINFCKYYATEEFFCNGTQSYMQAYPDASYDTAKVEASKFLTNPNILNYIDSLLKEMGLNDQRADKELAKMLIQDSDNVSKMKALDMYYKITARVEKGKQDALDKWEISKEVLWSSIDKLNALLWWD